VVSGQWPVVSGQWPDNREAECPTPRSSSLMTDNYLVSTEAWRQEMEKNLRAPNGWLALAGLSWLHEGANLIGADPAADVRLPAGTASPNLGRIEVHGSEAVLHVTGDEPIVLLGTPVERIALVPDVDDSPTYVDHGELRLVLIRRGPRLGIRLWDKRRAERSTFPGRKWYPIDPAWRVTASFAAHDPPLALSVPNVQGEVNQEKAIGKVVFTISGTSCSLEALTEEDGELFLIFADPTNGDTTYPSGRFLYAAAPSDGGVVLDFNRAYSPPCAFTPFATCPLPPMENRLAVRVEAGEMVHTSSAEAGR
jgi:hypothetical protein